MRLAIVFTSGVILLGIILAPRTVQSVALPNEVHYRIIADESSEKGLAAVFEGLLTNKDGSRKRGLEFLDRNWELALIPPLIETIRVSRSHELDREIFAMLRSHTKNDFAFDISKWYAWIWQEEITPHAEYSDIKSRLYRRLDPKFAAYFSKDRAVSISLDEVRWGGVVQDGIPPLRSPKMQPAASASYLADSDVVFGIAVKGDVRAYPKRILAWHEMFTDTVGGIAFTGVF